MKVKAISKGNKIEVPLVLLGMSSDGNAEPYRWFFIFKGNISYWYDALQ